MSVNIVQPEETDYSVSSIFTGTYDYIPATPTSQLPSTITIGGSETENYIFASQTAVDLSRITYYCDLQPSAAEPAAIMFKFNQIPWRRIEVRLGDQLLLDLNDVIKYTNSVTMITSSKENFKKYDKTYGAESVATQPAFLQKGTFQFGRTGGLDNQAYLTSGIEQPISTAVKANASTDYGGLAPALTVDAVTGPTQPEFRPVGDDFPCEFNDGLSADTTPHISFRLRFGDIFKGTIFTTKKDFWIQEELNIRITWESPTQWGFQSDEASFDNQAALTQNWTVSNQKILYPVQRNEFILNAMRQALVAGQLKWVFDIPFVNQTLLTGSLQTPRQDLPANTVGKIKLQFAIPFYRATSGGIGANSHNMMDRGTATKLTSLTPYVNGSRITSTPIQTGNAWDDWVQMQPRMESSILASSALSYRHWWAWVENYGIKDIVESIESDDLQGFDGLNNSYSYSIQAEGCQVSNQWFMVIIGQRMLIYTPEGKLRQVNP